MSLIKKRFYFLLLTTLVSAFIYWSLVKHNIEKDTIKHGLGWVMLVAPALFLILYINIEKLLRFIVPVSFTIAVCIGVFLGCLSGLFEKGANGLVIQSVIIVCSSVASIVYFYNAGKIKVNDRFMQACSAVAATIMASFSFDFAMSFIDLNWKSLYTGSTLTAITMNAVILALAFMVLMLELNIVDKTQSSKQITDKEAWKFSLDLLVDIAWIYGAVLFLLLRARGRKSS